MACALKLCMPKGGKMKFLKTLLIDLLTGMKNQFGHKRSLPGNYQMAFVRIKHK